MDGRWDYIREKSPELIEIVEKRTRGGKLVELGCGEGLLAAVLRPGTYSEYLGVDISEVAIERAKGRGLSNCTFVVGDLETWEGQPGSSMITIEECLYYLPHARQERLLKIALQSVAPDGAVLVAIHNKQKHQKLVEWIENSFPVVASVVVRGRSLITLCPSMSHSRAASAEPASVTSRS